MSERSADSGIRKVDSVLLAAKRLPFNGGSQVSYQLLVHPLFSGVHVYYHKPCSDVEKRRCALCNMHFDLEVNSSSSAEAWMALGMALLPSSRDSCSTPDQLYMFSLIYASLSPHPLQDRS